MQWGYGRSILCIRWAKLFKVNNFSTYIFIRQYKLNSYMIAWSLTLHRYLVWLEVFLTNINKSLSGAKELLKKGCIAVARSLIPGALSAVDKTMEETFMKFSKSAGSDKLPAPAPPLISLLISLISYLLLSLFSIPQFF